MTDDARLLAEIARLIERYGQERFLSLSSILKNPDEARALALAIDEIVLSEHVTRKRVTAGKQARTRQSSEPGSRVLGGLRGLEEGKYNLLVSFQQEFLSRRILPSMRDVRRFVDINDLSIGSVTSREKALSPLLRSMASLPLEEVATLLNQDALSEDNDRSLARWSDVISGRHAKGPNQQGETK